MKHFKLTIGISAFAIVFYLNLIYASKGYGLQSVFADDEDSDTETLPNGTYECDTKNGRPVYCNAREVTGTRAIQCPYYIITFYAEYTISSVTGETKTITQKDGPYGSFSDLVFLRAPYFEAPSGYSSVEYWSEQKTDYQLVRDAFIECEFVANHESRCSPLHKSCSDFVLDEGSGVYIGI